MNSEERDIEVPIIEIIEFSYIFNLRINSPIQLMFLIIYEKFPENRKVCVFKTGFRENI